MNLEHTKEPYINIWVWIVALSLYGLFVDSTYYQFALVMIGYKVVAFAIDLIEYLTEAYEDRGLNKYRKNK